MIEVLSQLSLNAAALLLKPFNFVFKHLFLFLIVFDNGLLQFALQVGDLVGEGVGVSGISSAEMGSKGFLIVLDSMHRLFELMVVGEEVVEVSFELGVPSLHGLVGHDIDDFGLTFFELAVIEGEGPD